MTRLEERYASVIQVVDRMSDWFSVRDIHLRSDALAPSTIRRIVETLVRMNVVARTERGFNARNFKKNPNWSTFEGVCEDYRWWKQVEDRRKSEEVKDRRRQTVERKRNEKVREGGNRQVDDLPPFLSGAKQSDWEAGTKED